MAQRLNAILYFSREPRFDSQYIHKGRERKGREGDEVGRKGKGKKREREEGKKRVEEGREEERRGSKKPTTTIFLAEKSAQIFHIAQIENNDR